MEKQPYPPLWGDLTPDEQTSALELARKEARVTINFHYPERWPTTENGRLVPEARGIWLSASNAMEKHPLQFDPERHVKRPLTEAELESDPRTLAFEAEYLDYLAWKDAPDEEAGSERFVAFAKSLKRLMRKHKLALDAGEGALRVVDASEPETLKRRLRELEDAMYGTPANPIDTA